MVGVSMNNGIWYLSNYPFKVHSVKDNDEIYFAALTTDVKGKNQPVIVGRGHLVGFTEENYVILYILDILLLAEEELLNVSMKRVKL